MSETKECGCRVDSEYGLYFVDPETCAYPAALQTIEMLERENQELREAVLAHWYWFSDDGTAGCRHCRTEVDVPEDYDADLPPTVEHAPDCIVERIEKAGAK